MARILNHAKPWSTAEEDKLRKLYPTTKTEDLAALFGRSKKAVTSRAKVLRIQKAIGHGGKVKWTRPLERELRRLYPDTHTDELALRLNISVLALYQRAQKLRIRKSAAYLEQKRTDEARRLTTSGVAHRFQKGQIPLNKGLRRPGWHAGRMRETQFKKGQAPFNAMPLWSFRWYQGGSDSAPGYLVLKTGKPGPKPLNGWEFVHKLIWEQANGVLSDWRDARLWWKDGDHANNSLSNLELLSAQEHMQRTTVHNLPAPLPQLIQLAGALKRKINSREKKINGKEQLAGPARSSLRDARSAV